VSGAVLEVRDLSARYDSGDVLRGVSFSVEPGGVTALLGANGAGKTTTLRAISGLVTMRGTVALDGAPLGDLPAESIARRGVAHVPEGRGTFSRLSVEENLRVGACTRNDRAEVDMDLERMYQHFPRLKERRRQQAGTLSGGEQQMLAIARALMLRPKLLLLDEPSFGLAPRMVGEMFAILHAVNESASLPMLLVEQNAARALALATRAHVLETGRLVFSGTPGELEGDERLRSAYLGGGH